MEASYEQYAQRRCRERGSNALLEDRLLPLQCSEVLNDILLSQKVLCVLESLPGVSFAEGSEIELRCYLDEVARLLDTISTPSGGVYLDDDGKIVDGDSTDRKFSGGSYGLFEEEFSESTQVYRFCVLEISLV